MNALTPLTPEELDQLARKRASARMGWYLHATVFVLVNAGLALLAALHGRGAPLFPAAGWSIGLAVHGAVVWLKPHDVSLYRTVLQRERQRLDAQRDPW